MTSKRSVERVGFIGGGQLARMMAAAASRLGLRCVVVDPTPDCPAAQLSDRQIVASHHDPAALRALAAEVDVITYDLEDTNASLLSELEAEGAAIYPSPGLLATVQDKLLQKEALKAAGIPTSPFQQVDTPDREAFARFGYPLVQKARRGGYDGRGVVIMRGEASFETHLTGPSLIERFIPAQKELGVVVARGRDGALSAFPPVEMVFKPGENVLELLVGPAEIPPDVSDRAIAIAQRTVEALDGVGVFGVELFWTEDNKVLVNEIAPRTHNSGHHTIESCQTDQFEQHLRAVTGLPLGSTEQLAPAAMANLLGAPGYFGKPRFDGLSQGLAIPGVSVHLYGKHETRPYRKMGHLTALGRDTGEARRKIRQALSCVVVRGEARDE